MNTENSNDLPKQPWSQPTIEELDITETTQGKTFGGAEGAFTGS